MKGKTLNLIFIIINILLYLCSIALWLSITEETVLNLSVTIFAIGLTVGLLIKNKEQFTHFYSSKYFQQLSSYLLTAFLIFFLLGLVNYLAYKNPLSLDLSPQKINSLSEKSKTIIRNGKDVTITVFSRASNFRQLDAFLELYRLENNDLEIKMVDAEINPILVKKYGVTKIPTLHFQKGNQQKSITELSELSITNAIYQVTTGTIPEIYITTGHGEIDFNNQENEGASVLLQQIKNSNINVSFVSLTEIGNIPDNIKALIIWGPNSSFFEAELGIINDYLNRGGNLMIAIDPQLNTDNNTLLRDWLGKEWGISLDNNIMIDRLKNIKGSNGTVPILAQFDKEHPITKNINHVIFFPIASAVGIVSEPHEKNKNLTLLARSMPYPAAWAEYSLGEIVTQNPKFNQDSDVEGPLAYVAALEHQKNRLLVYGNSSFVINTYQKFPKNAGFFLSGLSWLLDREEMITLDSPVVEEKPVFINQHQIGLFLYFSVLFLPLILIAIAIFFFWKKRTA